MDVDAGQVAVIPGAGRPVPFLIDIITASHCSHMVVVADHGMCVSADPDGVHLRPLADFPQAVVSRFEMTPEQAAQVVAFATAQLGKPYAFLDDALIGIERIFRFRFPLYVRRIFADDGQWQCAQLCDAALAHAGVQVFDDGRMVGDVFPGSYETEFIRRRWYTLAFFKSFKLRPW